MSVLGVVPWCSLFHSSQSFPHVLPRVHLPASAVTLILLNPAVSSYSFTWILRSFWQSSSLFIEAPTSGTPSHCGFLFSLLALLKVGRPQGLGLHLPLGDLIQLIGYQCYKYIGLCKFSPVLTFPLSFRFMYPPFAYLTSVIEWLIETQIQLPQTELLAPS